MTYEELWAAQVMSKARMHADIYYHLQAMIKSRTKAGYTNGVIYLDMSGMGYKPKWQVNTPVICVKVEPTYRGQLLIAFYTKR